MGVETLLSIEEGRRGICKSNVKKEAGKKETRREITRCRVLYVLFSQPLKFYRKRSVPHLFIEYNGQQENI